MGTYSMSAQSSQAGKPDNVCQCCCLYPVVNLLHANRLCRLRWLDLHAHDMQAAPIVRVAVEAARPEEMAQLQEGLSLLNRADPFVEVTLQDNGEHVLGAAGVYFSWLVWVSAFMLLSSFHFSS